MGQTKSQFWPQLPSQLQTRGCGHHLSSCPWPPPPDRPCSPCSEGLLALDSSPVHLAAAASLLVSYLQVPRSPGSPRGPPYVARGAPLGCRLQAAVWGSAVLPALPPALPTSAWVTPALPAPHLRVRPEVTSSRRPPQSCPLHTMPSLPTITHASWTPSPLPATRD
ncbi:Hypothetical predicted protein [Marmota monax]|uniref:Uncharacterized protein n=1 Tax=Marmota monax TaxID=9995 RepID=A0A5E4DBU2_MARMO|nr:Hypothetical predicted protein [Marmota monax]